MRALTVKQPWASLIASGIKQVENRTYPVPKSVRVQRIHLANLIILRFIMSSVVFSVERVGVLRGAYGDSYGVQIVETYDPGSVYEAEMYSLYVVKDGISAHVADRDTEEELRDFMDDLVEASKHHLLGVEMWKDNDARLGGSHD